MRTPVSQLGLFDVEPKAEVAARARAMMREVIDALGAASVAPWKNYMDFLLRHGDFKRAMLEVPKDEANALLVEYQAQIDRLDWRSLPD